MLETFLFACGGEYEEHNGHKQELSSYSTLSALPRNDMEWNSVI